MQWMRSKLLVAYSQASASVHLTPIERTRIMELIDSYSRTLGLTEIYERIQAIDNANSQPKRKIK